MSLRERLKGGLSEFKGDVKAFFGRKDTSKLDTLTGTLHRTGFPLESESADANNAAASVPPAPLPQDLILAPESSTALSGDIGHNTSLSGSAGPTDQSSPGVAQASRSFMDSNSRTSRTSISSETQLAVSGLQVTEPIERTTLTRKPDDDETTPTKWKGVKEFARVLEPATNMFGPIKEMVDMFIGCIDMYEMAETAQAEYNTLQLQVAGLLEDLARYFRQESVLTMTESMEGICGSIRLDLESVRSKLGSNMGIRCLKAPDEVEAILGCYRRIQLHLGRLSLNANLEMWKVVEDYALGSRMASLVDRLPASLSARYNSAEGAALKRRGCTQDTRVDVLALIQGWAGGTGGGAVYWMNGMAGTGKTTIAFSVCELLNAEHKLAASFFCSRLRGECRNVNLIFPSIAYQLARFSRPFMSALSESLSHDPDVHASLLHTQFEALIAKPLRKVENTLPGGLVVVIDALDECDDKDSTKRMLDLLLSRATSLPIRFIVSSRPEPEIRHQMSERAKSRLVLHELNKGGVQEDIKKYLREGLAPMDPSDAQIDALAEKSGILFIYAATAIRYIGLKDFGRNPSARLHTVLQGQKGTRTSGNKEMDELYLTILETAFDEPGLEEVDKIDMQQVLHTVVCAREPLTVEGLSELLKLKDINRVRAALDPMWSVLHVVETSNVVTTLHASFPDYLLDPTRSKAYCCDSYTFNRRLAERCFERIAETLPYFNICGLDSSYLPDEEVPEIGRRVHGVIPSELLYACRYWAEHLKAGNYASTVLKYLTDLLSSKLLLWMEVLNLTKQIKTGMGCMKLAVEWCKGLEGEHELVELAHDAKRFVEMFAANPVSQSTPHIYVSMLAFWPRPSPIAKHYAKYTRGPVNSEGTALNRRQLAHISTWAFEEAIGAMQVSPDGSLIGLGIGNKVLVLDSSSGNKLLEPLRSPKGTVESIAFLANGTRIIGGFVDDKDAIILGWDTRSGDQVIGPLHLRVYTPPITRLSFSPDCTRIATGSSDNALSLWDAETGRLLHHLPLQSSVDTTVFSPDSTYIAAVSGKFTQIWDSRTGNSFLGPLYHGNNVHQLVFTPDMLRIIGISWWDDAIYVWDTQNGERILGPIKGHMDSIHCIGCSPDGRYIVSGSQDRTVRVWDAQTGDIVLGPFEAHTGTITSVAFIPDGSRIVSACQHGRVCTWDAQQRTLTPSYTNIPFEPITCVKFSSDGTRFVSGSSDGSIAIWDARTGEIRIGPIEAHTSKIKAVDFKNDRVISGAEDGTICICDALTGEIVLSPLQLDTGRIWAVGYSPDGQMIASGSDAGIDVRNGQNGNRVLGPLTEFSSVSVQFSPDGTRIVGSSWREYSNIAVWEVSSGKNLFGTLDGHCCAVRSVSYSPNGALIVSGSEDWSIIVWDAATGEKRLGPFTAHSYYVLSVAFSPDSTRFVSCSSDTRIHIWDVKTGEMLFELIHEHKDDITSVEYSPDGTRILSRSDDMSVRIHDARSPAERALSYSESQVGDWMMDQDGWVVDGQSRLLVWVPGDLRKALSSWSTLEAMVAPQGHLRLKFDKSHMGESWADGYKQGI